MPTPDELRESTKAFFASHAKDFDLRGDSIEVVYVLNPGGFVNASFRITDGRTRLHAKLATTDDGRDALARWLELDPLLRAHRAPPVLAPIDLGSARGLVFPWLSGRAPDFGDTVARSVVECASALWADAALADRLRTDRTVTAADRYLAAYHARFVADLADLGPAPPPFLTGSDLEYLRSEVHALERLVREAAAFQEVVDTPVHGDLWLNNVLWRSPSSWWLLDWDDVQVGDPAMDLAMLTGPTAQDLRPLKRPEVVEGALGPAGKERLGLLGRASLLDWAIDSLADWTEASAAPEHESDVKAAKESVHRRALALYRESYAG